MDLEKNRMKEPGFWRMLLGALALGVAILVGFAVGLRVGDRNRRQVQPPVSSLLLLPPVDSVAEPDTSAVSPEMEMPEVPETPESPVEPEKPDLTKQQLAQGVEYLATHNRWNRVEMEKIPALAGLWDAVNTYELDEIRGYNERLASTPLTTIVDGLERMPKQGYYAAKTDHVITLSTYIKRLR